MGKRRKARRRRGPRWSARLGEWLGGISWLRVARATVSVAVLAGVTAGVVYGLPALEKHVSSLPAYQQQVTAELVDPPAWLLANPHIARRIIGRCQLSQDDGRLTDGLARRVAQSVSLVGWVKRVHEVSIGADDVLRIRCDYREPVAWVAHGSCYYLVDEELVRLPGRYLRTEVSRDSGLLLVLGVGRPPPAEGQPWEGDDLRGAIRMVGLLRDKPYFGQLTGVIVANYGGRRDRRAPHIELATDRGARIRWGRAPGEEIDEPTAAQKLAHLQGIWREYDRVDMGRSWVDIQVWPDRVIVPVGAWQADRRQRS